MYCYNSFGGSFLSGKIEPIKSHIMELSICLYLHYDGELNRQSWISDKCLTNARNLPYIWIRYPPIYGAVKLVRNILICYAETLVKNLFKMSFSYFQLHHWLKRKRHLENHWRCKILTLSTGILFVKLNLKFVLALSIPSANHNL